MFTNARLDEVFQKSKRIAFDDDSKYVFFSDVHRGDNSLSDEFGRNKHIFYHALDYYYQDGFTYVEVGDGDEMWETPKYNYIHNSHRFVFDKMKNFHDDGRMIMIYGNHNMALKNKGYVVKNMNRVLDDYSDDYEDLFVGLEVFESIILVHRETGQEIFVVHGHQGDFLNDQAWWVSLFLVRYFWRFMHIVGVKYAASPAKNRKKRHRIEKNYNRWIEKHGVMLLCGHTHRAKFPGKNELPYFNSGCCMHPRGIYCIEMAYGEIALVSWHMHTRKDGMLYIKRTILKGPELVSSFITSECPIYDMGESITKEESKDEGCRDCGEGEDR